MADTVNLVILGASGDLTHRLLLPGLGTLLKAQPKRKVHLVGASAEELTQELWQQRVTESVREGGCSADVVTRLVDGTRYVRIDATSAALTNAQTASTARRSSSSAAQPIGH